MRKYIAERNGSQDSLPELGSEDFGHKDAIKELLLKVKNDDGGFDFSKFKKLYTTKYINEELRN